MKKLFKIIWNFMKKSIKINVDVDVYILVNGKWIKIDIWQLKQHIEEQKNGIDTGIKKVRYVKRGRGLYHSKNRDEDFSKIVKKMKNI